MYDKFDDDVEQSGLRFDGNEPTFNRKKIRRIMNYVLLGIFVVLFLYFFFERQNYTLNERHLTNLNLMGLELEQMFTTHLASYVIEERILDNEGRRIIISRMYHLHGGRNGAQVRFNILVPNPFYGGNLEGLTFETRHGGELVPVPYTFSRRFWFCQMLNVTFTFTESHVPPKQGERVYINISGDGIDSILSFVMP